MDPLLLIGAGGLGGIATKLIDLYFARHPTKDQVAAAKEAARIASVAQEADSAFKIVTATDTFTNTILTRLAAVEAKVEILERENTRLRDQLYALGHVPLQEVDPK